METRLPIPTVLKRQLLVEAGHRCAIPTCRQVPVEFAHIVPWEKRKEHTFDNLICLCPTCHARYDRGEIDRKAMLIYKHNLAVLNGRYGDVEQRILTLFAEHPEADAINLPGGLDILVMNLIHDELLVDTGSTSGVIIAGVPSAKTYQITRQGREFVNKWVSAREIE